ncbi:hypothetical protein SRABI27_02555 [Pedobacter sp. Bi27]|uniref:hypothetical protein n=1 Tax=Pedobacter sp. Bi27 TaxID=2822351 RepID=UPI001D45AC77|nr:hypothetical protein [Pedobacter sp. Bi27]CAH0234199.1 hypothetical protein SRABI27_02555 [Pedobacter sp. Bi27]
MKSKNAIKTFSALLICLAIFGKAKAQDSTKVEQPTEVKSLNKIRLTILGLGYEREQKVGKTTSVYFGAGAQGVFIYRTEISIDNNYNFSFNTDTDFKVYPALNGGFRHYYNFNRRIKKGKRTLNNSAGYVGLDVLAIIPTQSDTVYGYQINIMPQWGFQTAIRRKVNFELALGPLAAINKTDTYYGIGGKIGFSFLL